MTDAVLSTQGLSRRFGGLMAVERRGDRAAPRPAARGARAERRRQDDAHQPAVRRPRGHRAERIRYKGEDITRQSPDRRSRIGIGRSYQKTNIFPALHRVRELPAGGAVARAARARTCSPTPTRYRPVREAAERALEAAGLAGARRPGRLGAVARRAAPARDRDGAGDRARGAAARRAARRHGRRGGAADGRAAAASSPREHAILLVEHDMDAVFAVADVITVMVNGQVLESGAPAQIRASPAVPPRVSGRGDGARMSESLLEARELHTYYGASHVLHGVDFRIDRGETVGLMGRNGMGKSTLIRSMLGLVKPRHGEVRVRGTPMTGAEPYLRRAAGHRLRARGPRHLPQPHRAREPGDGRARRPRRAARLDVRARAGDVSAPRRAPRQRRLAALRRRAADAHHRPRADDQPRPADPRRGDRRARAADREGDLAHHRRDPRPRHRHADRRQELRAR